MAKGAEVPTLSMFYGIIIVMFDEDGTPHKKPHFHAQYASYAATFDLDGNILAGKLPPKQKKLVVAWTALHYDELRADWDMLLSGQSPYKIDPLR